MLLNSKFDVLRGWPREGALDETFGIHQTVAGTDDSLPLGTVVVIGASDGFAVAAPASPNRTTTNALATWVVVAGNDDFSGIFTKKVTCLRSNALLRLDPANYTGAPTVGQKLTFSTSVVGKWTVAVATNQIIGEVVSVNSTDNTIVVMYTASNESSF